MRRLPSWFSGRRWVIQGHRIRAWFGRKWYVLQEKRRAIWAVLWGRPYLFATSQEHLATIRGELQTWHKRRKQRGF